MEYGAEKKRQLAEFHTVEVDAGKGTAAWSARSRQCCTPACMAALAGRRKKKLLSFAESSSLTISKAPFCREAHVQVQVETPLEQAPGATMTGRLSPKH